MKFLRSIVTAFFFISIALGVQEIAQAAEKDSIKKAKGGYTVEELFSKQKELSGAKINVRGKGVKFSSGIMGKNWIHLQDGTGSAGTNDITVTTNQTAQVGKIVLINGTLTTNKDFGFGYKYDVIIEEASINAE